MYGFVGSWAWGEDDVWSVALRFQKDWENWKIGAGYAYEDFTDELVNAGGGGVPNQGFSRHLKEWAGMASIMWRMPLSGASSPNVIRTLRPCQPKRCFSSSGSRSARSGTP